MCAFLREVTDFPLSFFDCLWLWLSVAKRLGKQISYTLVLLGLSNAAIEQPFESCKPLLHVLLRLQFRCRNLNQLLPFLGHVDQFFSLCRLIVEGEQPLRLGFL